MEQPAVARIGTRAPDIAANDSTRLYEALRRGRFVLAAPPGFAPAAPGVTPLDVNRAATAVLVRPDGYIAWAGRTPDGLEATLTRWGAAAPATSGVPA